MACYCIIAHPESPEERERVVEALHRARELGDEPAVMLAMAQLTGRCPGQES